MCSVPNCLYPPGRAQKGMCSRHYQRWYRKGYVEKEVRERKKCSIAACGNLSHAKGLCDKHYRRPEVLQNRPPDMDPEIWFWIHTEKNGSCLETTFSLCKGYGRYWVNYERTQAHRYAYESVKGPIPDGLFVCHSCDNRKCVNPDHLWLGTHQDNMDDMAAKNRRFRKNPANSVGEKGKRK